MAYKFVCNYKNGASSFAGRFIRQSTYDDQRAFGIPNVVLSELIGKAKGRNPNSVFVRDPCGQGGNMYAQYNWEELKTVI